MKFIDLKAIIDLAFEEAKQSVYDRLKMVPDEDLGRLVWEDYVMLDEKKLEMDQLKEENESLKLQLKDKI
jgi:hypothetical protein